MSVGIVGMGYVGLPLAVGFAESGADLSHHDALVPELDELGLPSRELDEAVADADLVVIVTAHRGIAREAVASRVPLTVDLRGVTRGLESDHVLGL